MVTSTTIFTVVSAASGRRIVFFFIFIFISSNIFHSVIVDGIQIEQFDESRFWILRPITGKPESFGQRIAFCSKKCMYVFVKEEEQDETI